jgi:hypothetical protein
MLPTVDFCGLRVTRLLLGANPFGGFSHQSEARNREMLAYYTPERVVETLGRAEAAGINTFVTNNGSPNVLQAIGTYFRHGGTMQWIAQVSPIYRDGQTMPEALDQAAELGAAAIYLHGRSTEDLYHKQTPETLAAWMDRIRAHGIPAGVAAHGAEVHDWAHSFGVVDFHAVCFYRCGTLHDGQGLKFKLRDAPAAAACIRRIDKPCIGYKIMAAGRIDAQMAFEYAFANIKPTDVVNVGMHRGDKDDMIEENVALVAAVLGGR